MTEIITAKNGGKTIKKDGVFLLSPSHPEDVNKNLERNNIAPENHFFILFSACLGYQIEALKNKGVAQEDIFIFEPDKILEEYLLKNYSDVKIFHLSSSISEAFEKKLFSRKKPIIIALESFKRAYPDIYQNFIERIKSELAASVENLKVSAYFSKVWFINFIRNLSSSSDQSNRFFLDNKIENYLGNKDLNLPVVIAASGPSLNSAAADIKKNQGRMIIFSVLSATQTLINYGIKPDFIVISDAGAANKLHGFCLPADIPVFASVYSSSAFLSSIRNPVIFYDLNDEIDRPALQLKFPSVTIDAGLLANRFSTGPVIFCGFDLSYSIKHGSHSSGNALIYYRENIINRLNPLLNHLSSFLKRRDIMPLDEGLFTNKQFLMVKETAENMFGGNYYIGNDGSFKNIKRLTFDHPEFLFSGRDKIKSTDMIKNSFIKIDGLKSKIARLLKSIEGEIKNPDSDICRKVFTRENISDINPETARNYYLNKIAGIFCSFLIDKNI